MARDTATIRLATPSALIQRKGNAASGNLIILKAHLGAAWFGKGGVARLFARQRVVAQEVEDDGP